MAHAAATRDATAGVTRCTPQSYSFPATAIRDSAPAYPCTSSYSELHVAPLTFCFVILTKPGKLSICWRCAAADGRQLQQIGIQPHITVRPTLRGLRAGKDEVLDRALRYLATGK